MISRLSVAANIILYLLIMLVLKLLNYTTAYAAVGGVMVVVFFIIPFITARTWTISPFVRKWAWRAWIKRQLIGAISSSRSPFSVHLYHESYFHGRTRVHNKDPEGVSQVVQ